MQMEHMFSTVTLTKTTLRNRMKLGTLDALLCTKMDLSFKKMLQRFYCYSKNCSIYVIRNKYYV